MKKTVTTLLIALMLNAVFCTQLVQGAAVPGDSSKAEALAAKLKTELRQLGVGRESKIELNLYNGTKIAGYLSEINDEDFIVTRQDDGRSKVRYDQVRRARGRYRHHRFALSASILGLALGVLVVALSRKTRY